jgi:hypothetical protein
MKDDPGGSSGETNAEAFRGAGIGAMGSTALAGGGSDARGRGRIEGGLASAAAAGARQMDDYEGAHGLSAAVTSGRRSMRF